MLNLFSEICIRHKKSKLSNKDTLKNLRLAHKLRNDDIIDILKLTDFEVSRGVLGDMFRSEEHEKFVEAGLSGLIIQIQ